MVLRALAGFLLLGLSSCFVVTDLGRFEEDNTPILTPDDFSDLKVNVRNMSPHVTTAFEFRVVDATNAVQARGILQPLGTADTSILAQRAVPRRNTPYHVDFFPAGGAGWRVSLDEAMRQSTGSFSISVDGNDATTNVNAPSVPAEPGKPATIHLVNLGPAPGVSGYVGRRFEVRIAEESTLHVVGIFRVPTLEEGRDAFDAVIPGVIAPATNYRIDVYTDNGSGAEIAAFRFNQTSSELSLEATWDARSPSIRAVGDAPAP